MNVLLILFNRQYLSIDPKPDMTCHSCTMQLSMKLDLFFFPQRHFFINKKKYKCWCQLEKTKKIVQNKC